MKHNLNPSSTSKVHILFFPFSHILFLSPLCLFFLHPGGTAPALAKHTGWQNHPGPADGESMLQDTLLNSSSLGIVCDNVPAIHESFKPTYVYLNPLSLWEEISSSSIILPYIKWFFFFYFLWTDCFQIIVIVLYSYPFRLHEHSYSSHAFHGLLTCSAQSQCSLFGRLPEFLFKEGNWQGDLISIWSQGEDSSDAFPASAHT